MASRTFTQAPGVLTLDELYARIARSAEQLNRSRAEQGVRGFAMVHLTAIYADQLNGGTKTFNVTFSDNDLEMSTRIDTIREGACRDFAHGDVYAK